MQDAEKYSQRSVVESLIDVIEAGHRVIVDRIDLGRVEASEALADLVREIGGYGVAIVFLLFGWLALQAAAVAALTPRIGLPPSLAGAAGVNLLAGVVVLALTRRSAEPGARRMQGRDDAVAD